MNYFLSRSLGLPCHIHTPRHVLLRSAKGTESSNVMKRFNNDQNNQRDLYSKSDCRRASPASPSSGAQLCFIIFCFIMDQDLYDPHAICSYFMMSPHNHRGSLSLNSDKNVSPCSFHKAFRSSSCPLKLCKTSLIPFPAATSSDE